MLPIEDGLSWLLHTPKMALSNRLKSISTKWCCVPVFRIKCSQPENETSIPDQSSDKSHVTFMGGITKVIKCLLEKRKSPICEPNIPLSSKSHCDRLSFSFKTLDGETVKKKAWLIYTAILGKCKVTFEGNVSKLRTNSFSKYGATPRQINSIAD